MIAAVMDGGGLERLAELAGAEAGAPIAIVVPRLGEGLTPGASISKEELAKLREYARARIANRPAELPSVVVGEAPVSTGEETLGTVVLLGDECVGATGVSEVLAVTAMATLTELAVSAAREQADDDMRSSLLELIRADPGLPGEEILRRAHRLGTDIGRGAVALCAELTDQRAHHVMRIMRDIEPAVLAEQLDSRIYALLPAPAGDEATGGSLDAARRMAKALAPYAIVGFSSFCLQPDLLHRAITEAEVVVDVLNYEAGESSDDILSSTYRLLINTLASRPEEVRNFYEDTVGPLVTYDEQYNTDLVGTLEAYLRHNCIMNATASAIYAHRHTVAYRLDRVRELSGLDPSISEDRERLGLGLKAYRILAPQLRR
jgi:sugar diacid utilization regulator